MVFAVTKPPKYSGSRGFRSGRVSKPISTITPSAPRSTSATCQPSRLWDIAGAHVRSVHLETIGWRPLSYPAPDEVEAELARAHDRHQEPAPLVGRVRLVMTPSTERHQLVEVEVGAALRALHHVVDVEPAPHPTGLTT